MIIEPFGFCFSLRDSLSVVFDEAPQTQLPPSIPSTSDVTVTIFDEDKLEVDLDKTLALVDSYKDKDTVAVSDFPGLRESLGIYMLCKD